MTSGGCNRVTVYKQNRFQCKKRIKLYNSDCQINARSLFTSGCCVALGYGTLFGWVCHCVTGTVVSAG